MVGIRYRLSIDSVNGCNLLMTITNTQETFLRYFLKTSDKNSADPADKFPLPFLCISFVFHVDNKFRYSFQVLYVTRFSKIIPIYYEYNNIHDI